MDPSNVLSLFARESETEYRAKAQQYLTSHQLADFRRCPLLYKRKHEGVILDADTMAYLVGRAAHTLILEGAEAYAAQYVTGGPINPKTGAPFGQSTKAWAEWERETGRRGLTAEQDALVREMNQAVKGHEATRGLLAVGTPEAVVRADYCGHPCQSRIDWLSPSAGIVDLKTCDDLTWFEADARRFGYFHQMAFYEQVCFSASWQTDKTVLALPVHIIAVEKQQPFRCGVWRLGSQLLSVCRQDNEEAIRRLLECERTNVWQTGYEQVRDLAAV